MRGTDSTQLCGTHEIRAEIVGVVLDVNVRIGDHVEPGDVIAVLESMKMEIPVLTKTAGCVVDIDVAEQDTVRDGDLLTRIDSLGPISIQGRSS